MTPPNPVTIEATCSHTTRSAWIVSAFALLALLLSDHAFSQRSITYGAEGCPSVGTRGRGGGVGHGSGSGWLGGVGFSSGAGRLGTMCVSAPEVMAGKVVVRGSISREEIQRVMMQHHVRVKACYQRALQSDPALAGRVVVELTIGEDGRVRAVRIKSSALDNAEVKGCILRVLRALRFPQPAGSGEVIVNYPFVFKS